MSDIALPRVGHRQSREGASERGGERAVKGKNWVWNSAAKREGRRERRRERWINEKRNLCTPRRPRCQCYRGPTLTKQPALFSGFLFLPFVERQRREKRFDPVSATPSSKHRSVTVGLLRDRRTGRAEGPQDGQREEGGERARCSVALCIERAKERTRTVLSTSSSESSELVSRIEDGETDKP